MPFVRVADVDPSHAAAFVLCIEDNELRDQALLLIESIRAFAGRYASSEIFAVAPRAFLGVDRETRARLDALEVHYHEAAINRIAPWYGSTNRLLAAAWAEERSNAEVLFVLDSDTLVLGEPEPPGEESDLAVRPVDVKGCASAGPDDPCEPYWAALCALAGVGVEALPWVETVFGGARVRATYNGGFSAVRRASGIPRRAAELFLRSLQAGLWPTAGNPEQVVASTGRVSSLASRYWGSNQAALSVAAWSSTRRVRLLDRRTNVPLHLLAEAGAAERESWRDLRPLHVHYHRMLEPSRRAGALTRLAELGVSRDQLAWIEARLAPSRSPSVARVPAVAGPSAGRGRNQALVILGMHRSGTSLVASALQRSGVAIGDDLDAGGVGNPRGHFEDGEFRRFHEALLASVGETWLTVSEPLRVVGPSFERAARELVARRADRPLWGWKDPRTCLALELWERLLPQACFLALYRHPVDVALSLWRRGGDGELQRDPWLAMRAWELHNRELLALRKRHPARCYLAQVPTVTHDLPALVRALGERFDLPLRDDGVAAVLAPAELAPRPELGGPPWTELLAGPLELYAQLEAAADLPESPVELRALVQTLSNEFRRELRLAETLLFALLERSPATPEAAAVRSSELAGERARGRRLAAELVEVIAERDQLGGVLAEIEGSRGYAAVRAWWALRTGLRRVGSGGQGANPRAGRGGDHRRS